MSGPRPGGVLLASRLKFTASEAAPRCARLFVRHTLTSWLLADVLDDAELVVSELVTNAVTATAAPGGECPVLLGVQVSVCGGALYVDVWDNDLPRVPGGGLRHGSPAPDPDEHGRGLVIVAAVSRRCGMVASPYGGKVAWAELPLAGSGPGDGRPVFPRGSRQVALAEVRRHAELTLIDLALAGQVARRGPEPVPAAASGG